MLNDSIKAYEAGLYQGMLMRFQGLVNELVRRKRCPFCRQGGAHRKGLNSCPGIRLLLDSAALTKLISRAGREK